MLPQTAAAIQIDLDPRSDNFTNSPARYFSYWLWLRLFLCNGVEACGIVRREKVKSREAGDHKHGVRRWRIARTTIRTMIRPPIV